MLLLLLQALQKLLRLLLHRLGRGALLAVWRLVLDDLADDDLEQRGQLVPLVLLLLELVEETGEGFGPALVHLDHLGLHVQKHIVDIVEVLLRKGLEDEQTRGIVQDHVLVAVQSEVTNGAQELDLVHRLDILLGAFTFFTTALTILQSTIGTLDVKWFIQINLINID